MKHILILFAAAVTAPALATPPLPEPELEQVSIPFANHRNAIRNFEAVEDDILYLQDRQRRWYRAELGAGCRGLGFAQRIGYDTRGGLSLDRFGAILVEGDRCPILSLTRSDGPPKRLKKKKGA